MSDNKWLRFGLGAVVALVLLFGLVFEINIPVFELAEEPASEFGSQAVRERIAIDTSDDSYFYNGADLIGYSDDHSTSTWNIDTSTGELTVTSLVTESTDLALSGSLQVGNGTPTVTQDGEDAYVEGQFEVDGEAQFDGTVDINGAVAIDGGVTNIGGGTPDVAAGDNDLFVTADLEVDGELELDGALDADSTSNFAGMATFAGGLTGTEDVENVMLPSVVSTAITYTAAAGGTGTVATIADGEIWLVHAVLVQVTTNFDATGDDASLVVGDGNDPDGFIVLADAELQAADTEGTGFTAGWQGMSAETLGAYLDLNHNAYVYAPSGAAETIDWLVDETDGETLAAGAATIYVIYTRIK